MSRTPAQIVRNRIALFGPKLDRFMKEHNGGDFTPLFKVALAEFTDRNTEDENSALRTRSLLAALDVAKAVVLISRSLRHKALPDSERETLAAEVDALRITDVLERFILKGGNTAALRSAEIVLDGSAVATERFTRNLGDPAFAAPAQIQSIESDKGGWDPDSQPTWEQEEEALKAYLAEKKARSKYQKDVEKPAEKKSAKRKG